MPFISWLLFILDIRGSAANTKNSIEIGHPCLTDFSILNLGVSLPLTITWDVMFLYDSLDHFIKFGCKLYFSKTLYTKFCSIRSKAFSLSKEIKARLS